MIYADYAATTPLDPRVLQAMMPYMTDVFFNAASTHTPGMQAQQAVMKSRMDIASHINAKLFEVVFTSGATEAINMAILGAYRAAQSAGSTRNRIVTMRSEHAAVRDAAEQCARLGADVVWVPCDGNGCIDIAALREAVTESTLLVSVMAVNNETGVMQDLHAISRIAHDSGAMFMTDATQAYGKVPLDVDNIGIDLMTFSAHKIYGPKGSGVLFVRSRKDYTCAIEPLVYGGGQERGMRSGTLNVPGIVGLAAAGAIALECQSEESSRIAALRDRFEQAMLNIEGVRINGMGAQRSYNISNVMFPVNANTVIQAIPEVACSKGSACSSAKAAPSPVLTAMGRSAEEADQSIRFSFGRMTTPDQVENIITTITSALKHEHV